jgi:hypothetical protein
MDMQWTQNNPEKEQNWRTYIPDFKTYYTTTVIKAIQPCYMHDML